MHLAHFPPDVLSVLTGFISFTDLVLLHACGDAVFNSKMRTAPIIVRLLTTRCEVYYEKKILSRFGIVSDLVHDVRSGKYPLEFIPKTAKTVFTSRNISCFVPASVDVLTAHIIGESASFARGPGELEVIVRGSDIDYHYSRKYITFLCDQREYDEKMVNLKAIVMLDGGDFKDKRIRSIVGYRKCDHFPREEQICPGNMWVYRQCTYCDEVVTVTTKNGDVCWDLIPCTTLFIEKIGFKKMRIILEKMSSRTENVVIRTSAKEITKVLNNGYLDLIPSTVKSVSFEIMTQPRNKYQHSIPGVKKRYPFVISIDVSPSRSVLVEDFTGVDDCGSKVFLDWQDMNEAMQLYPRLSTTSW